MPRLFISYRRSDTASVAEPLYERLASRFGDHNVFKDVDDIPIGTDFRAVIERELINCDVMLVLIGRGWLNASDAEGNRRLNNPEDFVRIEIELGLRHRHVRVIPVLVDNAQMPQEAELPTRMQSLAFQNAAVLRTAPDFDSDVRRLINAIAPQSSRPNLRSFAALLLSIALIAAVVFALVNQGKNQQDVPTNNTAVMTQTGIQAAEALTTEIQQSFTVSATSQNFSPTHTYTLAAMFAPTGTSATNTALDQSSEGCTAVVQGLDTENVLEEPVTGSIIGQLKSRERAQVLRATPRSLTSNYRWIHIESASGLRGWVRNVFIGFDGDCSLIGEYPRYTSPLINGWWARGFNPNRNEDEPIHRGWDFGALEGEAVINTPDAGKVVEIYYCSMCTPDRPNIQSHGIPSGALSILMDPNWGYGYGNAVIVAYENHLLPHVTRDTLAASGWSGLDIMCIYGQLSDVRVQEGQNLSRDDVIGTVGNTGNSTQSHLHLECRILEGDYTGWEDATDRIIDPEVLFNRLIRGLANASE